MHNKTIIGFGWLSHNIKNYQADNIRQISQTSALIILDIVLNLIQ